MPVVHMSLPTDRSHTQGPWARRNVAELSQTNFRIALRGFDRDEVRAILDSVAADYRVLQMQNASLQRQLANLEGVLQVYQHRTSRTLVDASTSPQAVVGDPEQPGPIAAGSPSSTRNERNRANPPQSPADRGVRIAADPFKHTLKGIDLALVQIPALPSD